MEAVQQETTTIKSGNKRKDFSTRKFRFWAQIFSLGVSIWIGLEFYLFVRYLEAGRITAMAPTRPPGVEGYLPISGLISLRDWFITGVLNNIHPASLVILLTIILISFVFKKSFCSWVCPVGFISEMIGNIGDYLVNRKYSPFKFLKGNKDDKKETPVRLKFHPFLDYPLRSLKYLLLAFFVYAVFFQMSALDIRQFVESPYNKVADIKMMKFFIDIDTFGLWTIIILFGLSIFLRGFWCRYLCPYGALVGLFSLVGSAKIRRDENVCISCGKCAQACPSFIKVDTVRQVISDECSGCLDCVDVCPAIRSLSLGMAGSKKGISKRVWAFSLIVIFWSILAGFKLFGPWQNSISTEEYMYHTERMEGGEYNHPGR
ncbi:MAG: 4Fe-4S binding protein [candidate division Zixibacteria bacterium]